ncbi:MAG: cyclic nucleotide-binding protein [Chloroflexi bacterium RBG_16_63_12]|nr:MAG: cyclic nucleotide-binding protein [Chloroflexi bacterium RBG_16_63_12]
MPTDAALLAEVPFFSLLDEQERADLATQLDIVHFPAGHTMWKAGDPGGELFVIRSGEAEVYFKNDTGERIVLETARIGDFVGELSLLDKGTRTASVVVTEDLEALRVDRNDLQILFRHHPDAALDVLAAMARRLRHTAELLRHTATRNVNEEVEDKRTVVEKAADWIAEFSGSILFLTINSLIFLFWIVVNSALIPSLSAFDPYPFGLLTMAVSLEAIILSIFVLLSQNRQAAKDRVRSDIEYDVNLKAELEIAHLHEKVDELNAEIIGRLDKIERRMAKG